MVVAVSEVAPHQGSAAPVMSDLTGNHVRTGESLIVLQWDLEDVQHFCDDYRIGPKLDPPYAMGEEHYTVLHCLGLKKPLPAVWDRLKHWN